MTWEEAKLILGELVNKGVISRRLTEEERNDFAYGNTKLSNEDITMDMFHENSNMRYS